MPDFDQLQPIFEALEFRTLLNRWQKSKNLQKNQAVQGDLFAMFTDEEAGDAKESSISTLENTDHEYHLLDN